MGYFKRRKMATRHHRIVQSQATTESQRWNHNIHYIPVLVAAIPGGARTALDVGCGDGLLARRLHQRVEQVTGIDLDADQIALALAASARTVSVDESDGIEYIVGDVMTHPFATTFDVVATVATLHHLDTERGLLRLADLVAPGGVLAIEGLARSTTVADGLHDMAGTVLTQVLKRTGGRRYFEHSAPVVWPPKDSFSDIRRLSTRLLPGSIYRRHHLWRYTLIWRKPAPVGSDRGDRGTTGLPASTPSSSPGTPRRSPSGNRSVPP